MAAVRETRAMIAGMAPRLMSEAYVFVGDANPALTAHAIAMFREAEGLSLILPAERVAGAEARMRLITLEVHSALDGIGLTAAVSAALTEHAIPCNVVAAYHHDHIFVPEHMAEQALEVLQALAANA